MSLHVIKPKRVRHFSVSVRPNRLFFSLADGTPVCIELDDGQLQMLVAQLNSGIWQGFELAPRRDEASP